MKPDRNISAAAIAAMFDDAFPDHADQLFVFSILLDSIAFVEAHGSAAWSISLLETGFRLNVGPVEAMTWNYVHWDNESMYPKENFEFSELRLLVAGSDCLAQVDGSNEFGGLESATYKSVGEPCWVYTGMMHLGNDPKRAISRDAVANHVVSLRDNQHHFLRLALRTPTGKIRQRSNYAQHHCPGLYELARQVVGGNIDHDDLEPSLDEAVAEAMRDSSEARRSRLATAPAIPDRYEATATAFRRNPDVIAEVLHRANGRCEQCDRPAPFVRASNGTPYLEVHHRVPLAMNGHDTVANAIALCPNCHRQAHLG